MIGLDIETTALEPTEGRLRLVQVAGSGGADVFDADELSDEEIRSIFDYANSRGAVAHNANFEELWARSYGVEMNLADTMIMSRVLYGGTYEQKRLRHGLADVARRELGEEIDKDEQTSDWSGPLTESQMAYARKDAEILRPLFDTLLRKLERANLLKTYRLENRVRSAVDAMERRGVAVHVDLLDKLIRDYGERAATLRQELEHEWGINPGSGKQLAEYFELHARKGWPKTPGGAPKTNQDAMRELLNDRPEVAKWIEWKETEKIRSTYGESLRQKTRNGRIHARFKSFGTATGRFSSSDPNLQNIPKRGERGKLLRGIFWSGAEDRVLVRADYASIELWLAAVRWDDPAMQQALREGTNMHVRTAAALFEVPVAEVTKEQKATGKIVNFALLYGGSPNRILQEFKKNDMPIDTEGAEELHARFFKTYTGFKRRREVARQQWNNHTYRDGPKPEARTGIDRRRDQAEWYGQLLNHEIQGTGADGIKFALARMHEDPFPDAYPVLTVHDEIVVEAPQESTLWGSDSVQAWMERHMVEGMLEALECTADDVPSLPVVEIEVGREWS